MKILKDQLIGVEFELKKENSNESYTEVTNDNGEIIFKNLYQGEYILKEKKTGNEYNLDENPINIKINFNNQKDIIIGNEKKKGTLKIIKRDSNNSEIKLEGVKFKLYDEEMNVLETFITNENGEAISKEYPSVGKKYYLKEIETKEEYNLNDELIEIELGNNIQKEIIVDNNLKKGSIKIIKSDSENLDVKLEGVKFELYDEEMNVLETLITDENGEAISKEYPSFGKKYYLKEIETKEEYNLNDKLIEIELENNIQKEIKIENELKKGWIRIIKQDLENSDVRLSGVQFELYDEDMNFLENLETDENGEILSKEYPSVNKKYFLKEIKTIEGYVLDDEIKEIELIDNQILDVFVKNAKKPKEPEIIKITKELEPKVIIEEIEPEPIIEKVIIGSPKIIKEVVKLPKTGM